MNVSYEWLREYTPVEASDRDFAHKMNMTGTEIKGFFRQSDCIKNVKVGKILEIKQHENADKLVVCRVDVKTEILQIVTAAKNVFEGALVPVALDGALLAGGLKIKKGNLRGVLSQGMFCSVSELGLTVNDYPGAIEDGILILRNGEPGTDVCELLGMDTTIFEADIVTNRPDCLSMIGVAREASATFRKPFVLKKPLVKGEGGDINDFVKINIIEPQLCRRYCSRVVTDIKIEPSPLWMIERLRASGVRAINNIVDITNYVMLEYGQPMHAFDLSCIRGGEIIVRRANEGETLTTLDGVERTLTDQTLVIADKEGAVGLAGIMGGENSEIKPETETIVFESANFLGANIRRSAKKLGMRTESSARFEKNLDPELAMAALDRACELVELLGAGKVSKNFIDIDGSDKTLRHVMLDCGWINKYLDISLSENEMSEILERLGFTVFGGDITVPSFRSDIENIYDISEEIARFYGYDNIPSKNFRAEIQTGGLSSRQIFEKKAGQILRACGLTEAVTFSFVSPKGFDKLLIPEDSILRNAMRIKNPLGEDTSIMRTTALVSMMDVLSYNYAHRAASIKMYENATVYIPTGEGSLPDERKVMTVGMYGDCDFFDVKGIIEEFLERMNIDKAEYVLPDSGTESYHPGRVASVVVNGACVGVFGQIHPLVQKNYDISVPVYTAELYMNELYSAAKPDREFVAVPKYPSVERDLALVCAEDVYSGVVEGYIKDLAGKYLESITVFDVYTGEQVADGYKSIAYSLKLRSSESTLSDEDIDRIMGKVIKGLEAHGIVLRA